MDKQMLKTWTFLLLCIVLPNVSVGASVDNKTKPHTLYEAVINKCPRLEKTLLHENWKDVFDNQCSNWTAIDGAKVLSDKEKTPIACLLLYESILSFCAHIKGIEVNIEDLIPTISSNVNSSEICLAKTGLPSLKGSEHDISEFAQEFKCIIICTILGPNGAGVSEICNLAYFFESFDGQKFREQLLSLRKNKLVQMEVNKTDVAPEPLNNSQSKSLELEVPHQPNNTKPKLTVAGEQSHANVPPEGPPLATVTNKTKIEPQTKRKEAEVVAPAQPQSILPNPLNTAEGDSDKQKQGKEEANVVLEQGSEHDANEENNGLPVAADALPDADGEESSDEKGQGEEPDQGGFPADVEEDDQEKKNKLSEPAATKGKPSTLHDEPTSNLNTPEDDMDGDSYFFSYFSVSMCMVIVGYVGYHNRHKIMALLIEGKRGKRNGRSGRRPNSANYHKLDTNLEEAISSSCTKNPPSNIIY